MAQSIHKPTEHEQSDQSASSHIPTGVSGELRIADLAVGQGLTDRYDELLLNLCSTSALTTNELEDGATRFCHHVRHTLNADTAYLCNRTSLSVVTTSSANNARESCEDTRELHSALTTMVSDLWNCETPVCPPDIKVFPEEDCFSYLVVPLATENNHLLIITNADIDRALTGDYLADALSATYEVFLRSKGTIPSASRCESYVLDKLQHKYRICSHTIAKKRIELFQSQLKNHAVEFKGLSLAGKKHKSDGLHTVLPESLYNTAQLWNDKFKATLDCYALVESAHGYKTLCDNEKLIKFCDSRTLQVQVHAESLTDLNYIATLQDLIEKSVIHASRIKFSVVSQAGTDHTDALHKLQDRFGIPRLAKTTPARPAHNIADEFDLIQINGIKKSTAARQK